MFRLHGKSIAVAPTSGSQPAWKADAFSAYERRVIFGQMVKAELRDGHLGKHRRRRLVQYAAKLQLSAVVAGRLVDEARHSPDEGVRHDHQPAGPNLHLLPRSPEERRGFSWLRAGVGCVVLALLGFYLLS